MNCLENKKPDGGGGVEVSGGQQIKSPGNFRNFRENRYIFLNPPPRMERGRGQGGRKGEKGRQGRTGPSEAG